MGAYGAGPYGAGPYGVGATAGGPTDGYATEVLADSPLAYYRLDDLSTATLADSSGNNRDGTYVGSPTLGAAGLLPGHPAGKSVDFPGTGSHKGQVADAPWMDTPHLTVECVVNLDTVNEEMLVERDAQGGLQRAFQFRVLNGKAELIGLNSGNVQSAVSTTTLVAGTTYHLAGTIDGSNIRMYVNGVLEHTQPWLYTLPSISQNIFIGQSGSVDIWPTDGRIDEVAIYGAALTDARIAAHRAAMVNDNFANAFTVVVPEDGDTYTVSGIDNSTFTMEPGEPQPTGYSSSRSAWWTYTPYTSGSVTIHTGPTTSGGSTDTEMGVYTGSAVDALTLLAGNSDGYTGARSIITMNVTGGTTYRIQVTAYVGSVMSYGLSVTGPGTVPPPPPPPPGTSYRDQVLFDGPLAYWETAESGGAPADASGNGAGLALVNGPTQSATGGPLVGGSGYVLFDGVDDRLDSTVGINHNDYTFAFWYKGTDGVGTVAAAHMDTPHLTVRLGQVPVGGPPPAGAVCIGVHAGNTWRGVYTSAVTIYDDVWHHVVCVWNGTAGVNVEAAQFTIYVDGVQATTSDAIYTTIAAPINSGVHAFTFGHNTSDDGAGPLAGALSNIALYGKALTGSRVNDHYQAAQVTVVTAEAALAATAVFTADGVIPPPAAALTESASLTGTAGAEMGAAAALTEAAALTPDGRSEKPAAAALTEAAALAADGHISVEKAASADLATAHATVPSGIAGPAAYMETRARLRSLTAPHRAKWLSYATADGAVQAFEFDTVSGTVLTDKSGNNRHATLMNTPTLGQPGLAEGETGIQFTRAESEYVSLSTAGLPTGASPYAIELVFKPDQIDGSQGLAQIGQLSVSNKTNAVRLGGSSNNAEVNNYWWANDLSVQNRRIVAGQTYHLVVEFDGTNRRMILNGTVIGQAAAASLNATPTNPTLALASSTEYFQGTLYKAAIYPTALGQTKARRNYEAVLATPAPTVLDPRDLPGVLAWYSARQLATAGTANGATVTAWSDQSGNGNHTVSVSGTPVFRSTLGPDGGPCVEFTNGPYFNLPTVFAGKASGYVIAGYQSSGPNINAGTPWKFETYVAGGQHYPYNDNWVYSAFGSTVRRDVIGQHAAMHTWHRLSAYSAPNDWALFQDGVQLRQDPVNTVSWNTTHQVGERDHASNGWIRLSYLLLLDHKPTAAEQAALERYFTDNPSGGQPVSQPVTEQVLDLTAIPLTGGAHLAWRAPGYAETYDYRVNYGDPVSVGTARSATVTGLGVGPQTIEVRGVSGVGPGPWRSVTVTPTTVYLFDLFDRADSATVLGAPLSGGPYTVQTGTAGILAGEGYSATNDSRVTFPAADDVDVTVTVTASGTTSPGPIVRYASGSDFYLLQAEPSSNWLRLYRRNGAAWDLLRTGTMTRWLLDGPERLRLRTAGRWVYAYRNDRLAFTFEDLYYTGAKTLAGFRFDTGTAGRVGEVRAVPGILPDVTGGLTDPATPPPMATRSGTARVYKGRDTKARDMESES